MSNENKQHSAFNEEEDSADFPEVPKLTSFDSCQSPSMVPDEASVNKNIQESKQRPPSLKMPTENINTGSVVKHTTKTPESQQNNHTLELEISRSLSGHSNSDQHLRVVEAQKDSKSPEFMTPITGGTNNTTEQGNEELKEDSIMDSSPISGHLEGFKLQLPGQKASHNNF